MWGTIGRVVAYSIRGPKFETSHRHISMIFNLLSLALKFPLSNSIKLLSHLGRWVGIEKNCTYLLLRCKVEYIIIVGFVVSGTKLAASFGGNSTPLIR